MQLDVGKVGGAEEDREHLHSGQQFRIGHQRQIDQALDRTFLQIAPHCIVFGLDLFPGRVRRDIDAEKAQAGEGAVDGLGSSQLPFTYRWNFPTDAVRFDPAGITIQFNLYAIGLENLTGGLAGE